MRQIWTSDEHCGRLSRSMTNALSFEDFKQRLQDGLQCGTALHMLSLSSVCPSPDGSEGRVCNQVDKMTLA